MNNFKPFSDPLHFHSSPFWLRYRHFVVLHYFLFLQPHLFLHLPSALRKYRLRFFRHLCCGLKETISKILTSITINNKISNNRPLDEASAGDTRSHITLIWLTVVILPAYQHNKRALNRKYGRSQE
jgi:hypothetical protein